VKLKLTTKTIATLALPPGKNEEVHWDSDLPGFGFRLRRRSDGNGTVATWVAQYKRAGRTRKITLGSSNVVGAEAARTAAKQTLAKVALGEDPAAERRERNDKDRHSLRTLVNDYLAAKALRLRPRTLTEITRYLTGSYFRPLHGVPIDTITRRDVAARVVTIERDSGSATAREARGALSTFFTWAMTMGLCESNPTIGSAKPVVNRPRERVLSDAELASIWRAADDGTEYGKVIRLLVLSGCRRAEVGDMAWSEIDLERGVWKIPAARSKNHREHTLPVMPMMREIIESVPRMATRPQLFGLRSHGFTNWTLPKPDLDGRSGVDGWTVHDIRRTVATRMADLGIAPHIVEAALNHQSGHKRGVAGVYNRAIYFNEVRAALAQWHDHIRTLLEGSARKVVPLITMS
jgi:integrase